MASRIGSAGYVVLLPNLYYRRVREFVMGPNHREAMFGHMDSLSNAMVCDDIQALLGHAAGVPQASTAKVGCVGYCMSGPFAFAAAAAFPNQVAAAASFHGVRLYHAGADSPHHAAAQIPGELYFGCAEQDEWAPPEVINGLAEHLALVGVRHRVEWYPGTSHGFVFPSRDGIYVAAAAERHWQRLLALLQRNLG